jgi:hypothetical protein
MTEGKRHYWHMPTMERFALVQAGYSDADINRMEAEGARPEGWSYPLQQAIDDAVENLLRELDVHAHGRTDDESWSVDEIVKEVKQVMKDQRRLQARDARQQEARKRVEL